MDKSLRIVYMGTPEFAVESLRRLVDEGYNVVGVVTMPDKPAGRGYQLQQSAVKQYAVSKGLPVLQPEKLKDESFLNELRNLKADLQIVVAFRMLPEVVWNMPKFGTFNLHASLLPQYRGAAPINWAVINGDKETGVTTFFLKHEIDTGNIILQKKIDITEHDNAGSIHDKLMMIGGDAVIETVNQIISGSVNAFAQDESIELRPAPKIFKDDCKIDWSKDAVSIHNFVRGLAPYPAAWSEIADEKGKVFTVKIFETEVVLGENNVGKVKSDGKKDLMYGCANGWIKVLRLQIAGKKAMNVDEFLRGFRM